MGIKNILLGPTGQFNSNNEFNVSFISTGPLTATKVSAWETNGDVVDLPDRTRASGKRSKPFQIKIEIPMHLREENARMAALKKMFDEGVPGYKSNMTIEYPEGFFSTAGTLFNFIGAMVSGQGVPEGDADSDGEMMVRIWTIDVDDVDEL